MIHLCIIVDWHLSPFLIVNFIATNIFYMSFCVSWQVFLYDVYLRADLLSLQVLVYLDLVKTITVLKSSKQITLFSASFQDICHFMTLPNLGLTQKMIIIMVMRDFKKYALPHFSL